MSPDTAPPSLYPIFTRVCLRCKRPINGYGFYTLYGYILVEHNGSAKKVHGCGEPVHHHCPDDDTQRVVPHDGGEIGLSEYARHMRNVAPGIDYNSRTERYAARVGKKRLGTHPTQERAEQARQEYLNETHATPHRRWRNRREKRERRKGKCNGAKQSASR